MGLPLAFISVINAWHHDAIINKNAAFESEDGLNDTKGTPKQCFNMVRVLEIDGNDLL